MVKGFIIYKNGKIPFVIDKYRMELFTDEMEFVKGLFCKTQCF